MHAGRDSNRYMLGFHHLIQVPISHVISRRGLSLVFRGRHGIVSEPYKPYSSHAPPNERPFRMAVIGSGPAGFYTAYKVMSSIKNAMVDMYESLPVPYGLVRFGVAPDHPEVKVSRRMT